MAERTRRRADWLTVREALDRVLDCVSPLEAEQVPLGEVLGRTLAAPLVAPVDQPPWDNSAMDGFAARSADILGASEAQPIRLSVVDSIAASQFPSRGLGRGEASRIMTGAPVPAGADCVVRIEHTRPGNGAAVDVVSDGDAGRNIRRRGEDVRRGETVLSPGIVLRPGEIGVLALLGTARVSVHRKARVGILATGDELVEPEDFSEAQAGRRIVNSNSSALAAAVQAAGGEPVPLGIARDDVASVRERIGDPSSLDALVTTAGASVGDHDLVKDALEGMGMRTAFWRVLMRPGSPFSFGLMPRPGQAGLPVFGLPGNPVSAVVTFEVLGKPALRRMHGRAEVHGRTRTVRIAENLRSSAGLTRFLRVRLEREADDRLRARLTGEQGSGILTSVARADALLVVPPDVESYNEGDSVVVLMLDPPDAAQAEAGF